MLPTDFLESAQVPEAYAAIPLSEDDSRASLRVSVLAKLTPEPVGGSLVLLRDHIDARVYLGCLADAGGRPHQWLEIWVQTAPGAADALDAHRHVLTNARLDARWQQWMRALEALPGDTLIRTEGSVSNPLPTLLRVADRAPVHPTEAKSGLRWQLCKDDDLLKRHGLPGYSHGLHRYLTCEPTAGQPVFAPVTGGAPTSDRTASLDGTPDGAADGLPFNLGAGLLLARPLYPLSYEDLLAVLAGGTWQGMRHGKEWLLHGHAASPLHDASAPERTFLGARVKEQRLVETFHLKIALLKDLFTIVRATIQQQQRPLLNLSADSFRATFAGSQAALPILWTARVMLANPGEAFEITAVSGQAPFFVRAGERRMSAYEPPVASAFANRRASMRIRALLDGGRDRTVIEGTLQVRDDIDAGKRDLAWIRLAVGGESVALYGHLERDRALGPQEWRFRSLAQSFSGKTAESLRAAEGVLFDDVPLQVVPVLSSPCDLYAMAVLAVRTLLANKQTTLAVALDEMTSLARSAANVSAKGDDLPGAIAGLFANDPRWAASLGPNRLVDDDVSPDLAFRFVPPAFWWETLAMMARMLPGVGPFGACRDYADAPAGGLHTVFDRSVADAERLILWSRELIVDNRPMNSEVQKALRAFLSKERESAGSV